MAAGAPWQSARSVVLGGAGADGTGATGSDADASPQSCVLSTCGLDWRLYTGGSTLGKEVGTAERDGGLGEPPKDGDVAVTIGISRDDPRLGASYSDGRDASERVTGLSEEPRMERPAARGCFCCGSEDQTPWSAV